QRKALLRDIGPYEVTEPRPFTRELVRQFSSLSDTTTSTTANPAGRQSQELSEIKPDGHQERSERAGEEGVASREIGRRDQVLSGCPERGPCTSGVEADREKLTAQGGDGGPAPSSTRERTPADYAIEHGEYLAKAAEGFL